MWWTLMSFIRRFLEVKIIYEVFYVVKIRFNQLFLVDGFVQFDRRSGIS